MIKREEQDTTGGNTGGAILKRLSNEIVHSFFDDEKLVKILEQLYSDALFAEKAGERIQAAKLILERKLGAVAKSIDLTTKGESINNSVNLKNLTDDELIKLAELTNKATG